jgi:hypothetical protein
MVAQTRHLVEHLVIRGRDFFLEHVIRQPPRAGDAAADECVRVARAYGRAVATQASS